MKFKDMLPKADGSPGSPASAPAAQPAANPPDPERTKLTGPEKEQEAEDERDKVNLEKRYPKMKEALDAGGLDKLPILKS